MKKIFLFLIAITIAISSVNGQIFNKNSPRKAEKKQQAKEKKLKKDYAESVSRSQKRTFDIQTPDVQKRMKQNQKESADREKVKKKKAKNSTKKARKKYR